MEPEWIAVVPGLWRHPYRTATGIGANAYALRLADAEIAVFSPPSDPSSELFAATEALGPVGALLAPNTGHDLGQLAWQARYPEATAHAPEPAIAALARGKPGLRPFQPLTALADRLAPGTRVLEVPGTRSGMTLFVVEAEGQRATFLDELINHDGELPLVFRLVFRATGSTGGVARNRLWTWIFCADKRAVARFVLAELEAHPPTMVLVSHGEPVTDPADLAGVRNRVAAIA